MLSRWLKPSLVCCPVLGGFFLFCLVWRGKLFSNGGSSPTKKRLRHASTPPSLQTDLPSASRQAAVVVNQGATHPWQSLEVQNPMVPKRGNWKHLDIETHGFPQGPRFLPLSGALSGWVQGLGRLGLPWGKAVFRRNGFITSCETGNTLSLIECPFG